jgi:AcrR family transcriptional regulator
MVDIAQAAGLTRPTLYATFPEKESIFSAVVETMIAAKMGEIREGLVRHRSFEGKLRFACDAWAADGYDLVRNHPDAADMFDLGFKSVCDGYDGFSELLAEILAEPMRRSQLKLSAKAIANTIVFALRGFKDRAANGAEMRDMIRIHVALVAAAVASTAK